MLFPLAEWDFTYEAYQPTSSMLSKVWVIRGTAVDMIVLSTATQNVARQSTTETKITLGSLRYRVSSDSWWRGDWASTMSVGCLFSRAGSGVIFVAFFLMRALVRIF